MSNRFPTVLAVAILAGVLAAQEPAPVPPVPVPAPLSRAELDKRARKVAYEVIELGAALFNAGERSPTPQANYEGTARLYEGALLALVQMLDHRPETVKIIQAQLEKSKLQAKPQDRAVPLREALDEVLKVGAKKIALWDRLGKEDTVRAMVKDFVKKAATNPKVNFLRDGKYKLDEKNAAKFEQLLVETISVNTGGPLAYTEKDMKALYAGLKITEAEFTALADDMLETLVAYKLPPTEIRELMAIGASTKAGILEPKK